MKEVICLVLVFIVLLIASALPGYAKGHGGHGHGHGHRHGHGHSSFSGGVRIGPELGGWCPWWWSPPAYPYYYPSCYLAPPVFMQEQSPVYVQPIPHQEEQYYWYFCPDAGKYYPYVIRCTQGWLWVVPPQPPSKKQ